jgi:hypothetical protein
VPDFHSPRGDSFANLSGVLRPFSDGYPTSSAQPARPRLELQDLRFAPGGRKRPDHRRVPGSSPERLTVYLILKIALNSPTPSPCHFVPGNSHDLHPRSVQTR